MAKIRTRGWASCLCHTGCSTSRRKRQSVSFPHDGAGGNFARFWSGQMVVAKSMMPPAIRAAGKWLRDKLIDAAFAIERVGNSRIAVDQGPDPLQYTRTRTVNQILATLR